MLLMDLSGWVLSTLEFVFIRKRYFDSGVQVF